MMKRSKEPLVQPDDELTRVLFQLSAKGEDLSFWIDNNLTNLQLMALETALRSTTEMIHEVVRSEMMNDDE